MQYFSHFVSNQNYMECMYMLATANRLWTSRMHLYCFLFKSYFIIHVKKYIYRSNIKK